VSTSTPVRSPDLRNPSLMTRRGWWLVVLNILLPGSAQVVAGDRKLGRFGLVATFVLWGGIALALLLFFLAREVFLTLSTNPIALWVLEVALGFYAVLWVILTIDTLRLVRLVRTAPRARGFLAGLAVVALAAGAGTAAYGAVVVDSARSLLSNVFSGGQVADPIGGRYNILLMGGDAGPDRIGIRPDSISVASIDASTGAVTMIGIPRNLQFAPFPEGSPMLGPFPDGYDCGVDCLISYLYTYGEEHPELYPEAVAAGSTPGVEAMRDAVQGTTGLTMQYYVLIEMQGFKSLIDALGGIDIEVKERVGIGSNTNPDGTPAEAGGWIEPGLRHMDGETALWYARSRYQTTDYARMERQREVQEAILRQADPQNVLLKFQDIARASADLATTDIPQAMLGRFTDLALKSKGQPMERLQLVPPEFQPDAPDFGKIHAAVAAAVAPAEQAE
jgi:polyisoprenyl-teichoic acid--peptidoglycan teichoic acid transferase